MHCVLLTDPADAGPRFGRVEGKAVPAYGSGRRGSGAGQHIHNELACDMVALHGQALARLHRDIERIQERRIALGDIEMVENESARSGGESGFINFTPFH